MSTSDQKQAEEILSLLRDKGESVSTAESITGGLLGATFTEIPGASEVFLGGIIAYRAASKSALLQVEPALIHECGAVSGEVARAMAKGALVAFGSTWALATTGVAGPGASQGVAPGTVWISIARVGGPVIAHQLALTGDRQAVRSATITCAFEAFTRILKG